ncbi:amidohydrolase/deacetylase family metallohydrolase [Streptomyces iconiensis]|uniref:Amidohydrolase/deacetylase family metallohydrolase n=1 Tax=Streptomyces iconiensis TaxID=1384038 RepID=A0ABT6ZXG0_9ACTN|nr:amidohydrolase/deacetylase family metallohydrolase [Streptomyces iconiensis]MDJ1133758.1 amidohydrolase/deacetylase family metallohydrolase [Streptomyces iconiensis]
MYELLVSGGLLADPERGTTEPGDLAVHEGRIAATGAPGSLQGRETLDADGLLVTPGLIDLHTHVYADRTGLGVDADAVGVRQGVTTVVDAGSCGSDDWPHFRDHVVAGAVTRVLSWLNISRHGLVRGHRELAGGARDIDTAGTSAVLAAHRGTVRGIKVRMSRSVLGGSGLAPLRTAKETAGAHGLPVMVHVGNEPPALADVLDLLGHGDVVTHAFHGKDGGLFGPAGLLPEAGAAVERGVRFDVGHGSASFAFRTAERALEAGIRPYTASTDLHCRNVDGPVHSLTSTLSKLLALGMPLTEVLACATTRAARVLGLDGELGTLRTGAAADLSLLRLREAPVTFTDATGERREGRRSLVPYAVVRAGVPYPVRQDAPPASPTTARPTTPTGEPAG